MAGRGGITADAADGAEDRTRLARGWGWGSQQMRPGRRWIVRGRPGAGGSLWTPPQNHAVGRGVAPGTVQSSRARPHQRRRFTPQEFPRTAWKIEDTKEPLPMGLESSGSKFIQVGSHPDFPTDQILLVDLSPFDNVFFSLKQKGVKQHYKDVVESPVNKYRGNFHGGCMRYLDARDAKTNKWPLASNKQCHLFVDVILKALQIFAKVPVIDRKAL